MILPIIIDTSSMFEQFTSLTHENVNNALDNVAKGLAGIYANKLELEAQQALHQTRKRYIQNIKVIDSGKLEGTVLLDYSKDPMVQMLEEGANPFDMKQAMLASSKAKFTKKGTKYLTIPFRWATPGAVADADVFVGVMPNEIYKVVKNKPTVIPVSGGGMRSGGISLKEIPAAFQAKQIRPAIMDQAGNELFKQYEHKNSVYEGIVKRNDPTTGQNTYGSFRRVSENSDPNAFIHPGIKAYNLIQKALGGMDVANEMSLLLDNELEKLGLI